MVDGAQKLSIIHSLYTSVCCSVKTSDGLWFCELWATVCVGPPDWMAVSAWLNFSQRVFYAWNGRCGQLPSM